jgi:hypothetical protein
MKELKNEIKGRKLTKEVKNRKKENWRERTRE